MVAVAKNVNAAAVALVMLLLVGGASAQGTVTCKLTVDNVVEAVYVGGSSLPFTPTSCKSQWWTVCTFTFPDTSTSAGGQVIAVEGSDDDPAHAAGTDCIYAGLLLACSSTNAASSWNNVRSETATWKSASYTTRLGGSWYQPTFVDSAWSAPELAQSGFSCTDCGNSGAGVAPSKIWGCVRACMYVHVRECATEEGGGREEAQSFACSSSCEKQASI